MEIWWYVTVIILYYILDTDAWNADTLFGHVGNVSCCLFHPQRPNLLITDSEDKTVRVWDCKRHTCMCVMMTSS